MDDLHSTTIHRTKGCWGGGSWHWASVSRKKTEGLAAIQLWCRVGWFGEKESSAQEMHYGVEFLSNVVMASNWIRTLSSSVPLLSSYNRLPFARIYSNVSKRRWIHWRWSRIISGPHKLNKQHQWLNNEPLHCIPWNWLRLDSMVLCLVEFHDWQRHRGASSVGDYSQWRAMSGSYVHLVNGTCHSKRPPKSKRGSSMHIHPQLEEQHHRLE